MLSAICIRDQTSVPDYFVDFGEMDTNFTATLDQQSSTQAITFNGGNFTVQGSSYEAFYVSFSYIIHTIPLLYTVGCLGC